MDIQQLLHLTVTNKASDLHLLPGVPPAIRIDGVLSYVSNYPILTREAVQSMIFSLLNPIQRERFLKDKELDFSFGFGGGVSGDLGRFRGNVYYQRGFICAEFRFLEPRIRTIEELNLPKIIHNFSNLKQGLILVTGPTGHGKSTTLASIINEINLQRSVHILTVEDPDVVLVGEMRDPETISSTITIAETGHLVFSTLHTNSAAQSIDRIIDA